MNNPERRSSNSRQSLLQINAYMALFVTLVTFIFEPEERNCTKEKITTFTLIIDIMSAKVVSTDVQPVYICFRVS